MSVGRLFPSSGSWGVCGCWPRNPFPPAKRGSFMRYVCSQLLHPVIGWRRRFSNIESRHTHEGDRCARLRRTQPCQTPIFDGKRSVMLDVRAETRGMATCLQRPEFWPLRHPCAPANVDLPANDCLVVGALCREQQPTAVVSQLARRTT